MKKRLFPLALVLISLLVFLASCNIGGDGDDAGEDIKVILAVDEGAEIVGESVAMIKSSEEASFTVKLADEYIIKELSHGEAKNEAGEAADGVADKTVTVCVGGLKKDTVVKLFTENLGYPTTETFYYLCSVKDGDTSSQNSGDMLNFGTKIELSANCESENFIGWSIGNPTIEKDELISTERKLSYRVRPEDAVRNGVVRLIANYVDKNSYFYDISGFETDFYSTLAENNEYYTTSVLYGKLMVTYTDEYLSVFECPPLFYDDGTFSKEGSVLAEYNTKPDGTGESFSLGSRFYLDRESSLPTVFYPIFKEASDESDFEYADYASERPVSEEKAPFWKTEGVIITKYNGNDAELVIPEKIGGKFVTGIASGAFSDLSTKTLILPKFVNKIEKNAFCGMSELETLYFPDSVYEMYNESFDDASYENLTNFYLNATMAPRYADTNNGAFSVKLSRLLADCGKKRIIVIGGSSAYQGLSSEYMEALLGGDYRVINFGTTRTTNGIIYLEAMAALAKEGDIVLFAPENSTYMMGENELYWKTLSDLESMYNFYRLIDFTEYDNMLGALCDYNQNYRYDRKPSRYEASYEVITEKKTVDRYGEYQHKKRVSLSEAYVDSYYITMNKRFKSKYDLNWDDEAGQSSNRDYTDPANKTWESIDAPYLRYQMNRTIELARSGGASVYFSFSPVDADKLVDEAKNVDWLLAYDALIEELYCFDGVLGSCIDYIYAHKYIYDCAFHLNDVGRTYRTYQLYSDLCGELGLEKRDFDSVGTSFGGCIFRDGGEISPDGLPITKVDYLER